MATLNIRFPSDIPPETIAEFREVCDGIRAKVREQMSGGWTKQQVVDFWRESFIVNGGHDPRSLVFTEDSGTETFAADTIPRCLLLAVEAAASEIEEIGGSS
jgi:hypothetical protein